MSNNDETLPGGNETILVVEDDELVRGMTIDRLQRLGYKVVEAENARQALLMLELYPDIKLLFTDIVMPGGMSGIELVEQVSQIFPKLAILVTSGYTERLGINDRRLPAGTVLLSKPYRWRQLAIQLRQVLDHAHG